MRPVQPLRLSSWCLGFFLLLLCVHRMAAQTPEGVHIGEAPAWVDRIQTLPEAHSLQHASGLDYLLDDQQAELQATEKYSRIAVRILSESGRAQVGEVHLSFDPTYQTLTLHHAVVRRGTEVLDRLDPKQISLMRRETSADIGIYDGNQTVMLVLGDLRVGDVIDYDYTLSGKNPVFEGHVMDSWFMQYASPMERLRLRLLLPEQNTLRWTSIGQKVEAPQILRHGTQVEWIWDRKRLEGIEYEAGAPYWYSQFPYVQISDHPDWASVVSWARGIYPLDTPLPPELKLELARISKLARERQVVAALDWVQKEIRYLSLSLGESSHRPHLPAEVCAHRFGDCKDKALLLATMLQELGFDAVPAFVNTVQGEVLPERLPSSILFDHAIVHLRLNDADYWLDPTRQYQAGALADRTVTSYKWALPLRAQTRSLVKIVPTERTLRQISADELFINQGLTKPVRLEVTRRFAGIAAVQLRGMLATSTVEHLRKELLNGYSRMYPSITLVREPVWADDKEANVIVCTSILSIPDFWKRNEQRHSSKGEVMPIWLDELLEPPSQLHRSTPYNYGDPMLLKQRIRIKVNQELAVEAKSWTSKTDAFELQQDSSFHDQTLEINYTYRTTKESIPANRMEAFTASIKQLREHLGYYVSLNEKPGSDYRLNWMGLFLLVLLTGVIGYVCFRIASIPGKPALVVAAPSHLQGLGGWLILVGISLVLRPFSLASTSLHTVQPLLNLSRWQLLTDPEASSYHAVLPPLLLAEATFNVFLLASSITVLILFFRKSYQFPKWMCVILITAAVGQCGDTVASSLLFSDKNLSSEQIRAMAQSLVGALIWVPYFLVSKRVKATFIEDRLPLPEDKKTTPEQEVV